jgi:REP element-mobilizing transposase RayT
MVKQNILPPFNKRIWQRNYWEHIIRNENEYQRIAQYIIDNPKKWNRDQLNRRGGFYIRPMGKNH